MSKLRSCLFCSRWPQNSTKNVQRSRKRLMQSWWTLLSNKSRRTHRDWGDTQGKRSKTRSSLGSELILKSIRTTPNVTHDSGVDTVQWLITHYVTIHSGSLAYSKEYPEAHRNDVFCPELSQYATAHPKFRARTSLVCPSYGNQFCLYHGTLTTNLVCFATGDSLLCYLHFW